MLPFIWNAKSKGGILVHVSIQKLAKGGIFQSVAKEIECDRMVEFDREIGTGHKSTKPDRIPSLPNHTLSHSISNGMAFEKERYNIINTSQNMG